MNDDNDSSLSDKQIEWAINTNRISGSLSIIGSTLVLYSIYQRKLYQTSVYGRIMIGICSGTLITSIIAVLGPIMVPKDVITDIAMGNTATCTAGGFMLIFGAFITLMYFVCLMVHFVLTICFGYTEYYIEKHIDKYYHILSITLTLIRTVVGLFYNVYNPIGPAPVICMVASYPISCNNSLDDNNIPCERGEYAKIFSVVTLIIPCIVSYIINNICLYLVFRTVQKRQNVTRTFRGSFSTFKYYKLVERQSAIYAISFFFSQGLVIVPPIVNYYFTTGQLILYNLQLTIEATFHLQGFWNFLIFILPRYTRIQSRNKRVSKVIVLFYTIFSEKESTQIKILSTTTPTTIIPNNTTNQIIIPVEEQQQIQCQGCVVREIEAGEVGVEQAPSSNVPNQIDT